MVSARHLGSHLYRSHIFSTVGSSTARTVSSSVKEPFFFLLIEFKPKVKEVHRRRELIHHLQNVVAPDLFNRRIVYDGDSIAYSPGRLPSLAGHSSGNV